MRNFVTRAPIIGVMGSHAREYADRAEAVGRLIARSGAHLLTGGGRGVMAAAARGFAKTPVRRGLSIGVLPSASGDPRQGTPPGYLNQWIEIAIVTHLPHRSAQGISIRSRNHINILSSNGVIVLPGGPGTRSEARLACHYGVPALAFLTHGEEMPGLDALMPIARHIDEAAAFITCIAAGGGRPQENVAREAARR